MTLEEMIDYLDSLIASKRDDLLTLKAELRTLEHIRSTLYTELRHTELRRSQQA